MLHSHKDGKKKEVESDNELGLVVLDRIAERNPESFARYCAGIGCNLGKLNYHNIDVYFKKLQETFGGLTRNMVASLIEYEKNKE